MQNDKNVNETEQKMTRAELLLEIERQKAIIAAKERGESVENITEAEKSCKNDESGVVKSSDTGDTDTEKGKSTVWKKVGKIAYTASLVLLSLILVVNVYMMLARSVFKKQNPTFFGIGYAVVLTDSMNGDLPDSIPGNSLIFTVKKKSYEVGDVITFSTGKMASVTHRIVALEDGKFVTKGDANNKEDEERVECDAVVGKVFLTVRGAGGFIRALTTPLGLLILSCICLGIFGIPYLFGYYDEEEGEN